MATVGPAAELAWDFDRRAVYRSTERLKPKAKGHCSRHPDWLRMPTCPAAIGPSDRWRRGRADREMPAVAAIAHPIHATRQGKWAVTLAVARDKSGRIQRTRRNCARRRECARDCCSRAISRGEVG